MIGIDAQLFLGAGEHRGAGYFGAGSGKGRHGGVVNGRLFNQVPSLVVGGRPGVGEHEGDGFGQIHGAAAADADHPRRVVVLFADHVFFDLRGELVHIAGFGFIVHIDPNHQIVGVDGQTILYRAGFKDVVHQKDHHRFTAPALVVEDIPQL